MNILTDPVLLRCPGHDFSAVRASARSFEWLLMPPVTAAAALVALRSTRVYIYNVVLQKGNVYGAIIITLGYRKKIKCVKNSNFPILLSTIELTPNIPFFLEI